MSPNPSLSRKGSRHTLGTKRTCRPAPSSTDWLANTLQQPSNRLLRDQTLIISGTLKKPRNCRNGRPKQRVGWISRVVRRLLTIERLDEPWSNLIRLLPQSLRQRIDRADL